MNRHTFQLLADFLTTLGWVVVIGAVAFLLAFGIHLMIRGIFPGNQ